MNMQGKWDQRSERKGGNCTADLHYEKELSIPAHINFGEFEDRKLQRLTIIAYQPNLFHPLKLPVLPLGRADEEPTSPVEAEAVGPAPFELEPEFARSRKNSAFA